MPEGGARSSMAVQAKGQFQSPWSVFSPGVPLSPVDPQPTRVYDFPLSINTSWTPRAYEPFSFAQLRAFSNVELVRLAIETRKSQFERLEWQIKPKGKKGASDAMARAAKVQAFFERPDGETRFGEWIRQSLEDLLSIDAPTWEKRRDRGGRLIGLDIVPGDTIKPLVDETGRRPRLPEPAFQQIIKGRIWNELTSADLLYRPRNLRPNHIYGFSPVEQIIVTINIVLRRQTAQLAYFSDANVPAGLLNAPEGWTPDNIKEYQAWFDARLSQQGERAKLLWGPFGTKYQAFKDAPLKDDFDEWLARIVQSAFDLPPTPFIKQMNRGTSENDKERADEEGIEPLKCWWKRIADDLIELEFGQADLEWGWNETAEVDALTQAEIDDKNLRNGSTIIDEVRDGRGQEPLADGLGAKPLIYTAMGATLVDAIVNPPEPAPVPTALQPGADGEPPKPGEGPAPKDGEEPPKPDAAPAKTPPKEKVAKAAPRRIVAKQARPKLRRLEASVRRTLTTGLKKAGDDVAAQVLKHLTAEKIAKAADDAGWIKALDLSLLIVTVTDIQDDVEAAATDAGAVTLGGFGATDETLTNQVDARAVAYAKNRAAQLVSLNGDPSLVASTRDMIAATISEGLEQNIGADAIAESLQESYAFSADRAETIARTEIATANSQVSLDAARLVAADGTEVQKEWLLGDEACDECQDNADEGPIGIDDDFPSGDDTTPAHPNCLPGDALVSAQGVTAATKRWYDGDLVIIRTAAGNQLACTPNHPILTDAGWVAASRLDKGSHVISCNRGDRISPRRVLDHQDMPARIEDVAEAFSRSEQVTAAPVPVAPEDFHGDGEGSKVAVVWTDRLLLDRADPSLGEHAGQNALAVADMKAARHDGPGVLDLALNGDGSPPSRGMRGLSDGATPIGAEPLQPQALGLAGAAYSDAHLQKASPNTVSVHAVALRQHVLGFTGEIAIADDREVDQIVEGASLGLMRSGDASHVEGTSKGIGGNAADLGGLTDAFSGKVFLDRIVSARRIDFSGHVYNLQTERGWYVAEGIITHNCVCDVAFTTVDSTDDGSPDDSED